jgi:hypothetical protein
MNVCVVLCRCSPGVRRRTTGRQSRKTQKSRQHSDFPGGHPPEYYPSLRLLNFAKRTGYGALSLRWPSTNVHVAHYILTLTRMTTTSHLTTTNSHIHTHTYTHTHIHTHIYTHTHTPTHDHITAQTTDHFYARTTKLHITHTFCAIHFNSDTSCDCIDCFCALFEQSVS